MDKNKLEELQALWDAKPTATVCSSGGSPENSGDLPDRLPLKSISLLPSVFQCRSGASEKTGVTEDGKAHVACLAAELNASAAKELDPITVMRIDGKNVLIDGHHRLHAYRSAERSEIPVEYFSDEGGPRAALLNVGAANRKTKLVMSAGDRSQWGWELVKAGGFSKADVRAGSGVSDGTVAEMRRVLKGLREAGKPIPDRWFDARPRKVFDHESASVQAQEWAQKLTQAVGPAKSFNTLGKKGMLAEALQLWSPRLAEELTMLLAEDMDLTARVEELHGVLLDELSQERLDQLIHEKADALLRSKGYVQVDADGVALDF